MKLANTLSLGRAALGIMHGRGRAFGGPVVARLGLTDRCNLTCIHCFYHSPLLDVPFPQSLKRGRDAIGGLSDTENARQPCGVDVDMDALQRAIDDLLGMGTRRFAVSGGGELFLHDGVLGLLAELRKAGCHCSCTTNGTRLTPDVTGELLRIGMDEIRVTTMGGSADVYARTHPGAPPDAFADIERSLRRLGEEKAKRGLDRPRLTLITVVLAQNWEGVVDFASFAADMGAQQVLINPVNAIGEPSLAQIVPSQEDLRGLRGRLTEAQDILARNRIANNIALFRKVCDGQTNTTGIYRQYPCYAGWLSTFIRTNGDVHPCCRCCSPFGNICERSIREIWYGEEYSEFRRRSHALRQTGWPPDCDCGRCDNYTRNVKTYEALHPFSGRNARLRVPDILGV